MGLAQAPIQRIPEALSLGIRRLGRETDHSPPYSAEVKECVELYLHYPVRLMAWCSIKAQGQLCLYIPLRYILILSSHLYPGLPTGLFHSDFPVEIPYAFVIFPVRVFLGFITLIMFGNDYEFLCSLCSFLHFPVASSALLKYPQSVFFP
jgi:hypothetical protein